MKLQIAGSSPMNYKLNDMYAILLKDKSDIFVGRVKEISQLDDFLLMEELDKDLQPQHVSKHT